MGFFSATCHHVIYLNIQKDHVENDLGQPVDVLNVMKRGWFQVYKAHEIEAHWDGVEEANSLE